MNRQSLVLPRRRRGPPGCLRRRATGRADLPAGRRGGESGGPRAAGQRAGARRRGAAIAVGGAPAPGSVSFTEFIADRQTSEPDVEIHADDIWEILFTSGTTALPKG